MWFTRRSTATVLGILLAGHLFGGTSSLGVAMLADSESVPASLSTAACFGTDTEAPIVADAVISKSTPYLPGYIRQGGTYHVYANVSDPGCAPSGVASVTADVSTITTGQTAVVLSAGSYSIGGTAYGYRSASLTAKNPLAEGSTSYSITATDNAANSLPSAHSVIVDNTRPAGSDVQATNGSLTVGKPELGDIVTYTFNDVIDPQTVLAGWTGASTNVVVRIVNNAGGDIMTIRNAANSAQLPLGSVNLIGTNYVTANRDFGASGTRSTMVQSGTTITITLGTPSGATATQLGAGAMSWTPVTTPTDRAGNACLSTVTLEMGAPDVEF